MISDAKTMPVKSTQNSAGLQAPTIGRETCVMDIVQLCPAAADIMAAYGLHCFSCTVGGSESLADGCSMHGFDSDTVDALIEDINDALLEQPPRNADLTITSAAAESFAAILKQENKEDEALVVMLDTQGEFCLEITPKPDGSMYIFTNENHPDVRICADSVTLWRIGGSTIDFRDGRFKLDLDQDQDEACDIGGCGESCGCK